MTAADQIVDIAIDPAQRRRQRWRAAFRIGLPIFGVSLVILTIAAIAIQTTRSNQEGVLALSDELLASLQDRVTLQVSVWLQPAEHALLTARDLAGSGGATSHRDLATAFAASTLRQEPEIAQFSFADSDGDFLLVRRGADSGTDVKTIRMLPAPRETAWTHFDAAGQQTGQETDPKDDYDARTRPWYNGALAGPNVFWTPVYIFFTDKTPGITAAVKVPGGSGRTDVVGVDISLRALSGLLASLTIGKTGQAAIVGPDGNPIAASEQIDRTMLAAAWDHYRLEGPGHRILEIGGRRIVTMVEPLRVSGIDWQLVVIVPADEFTGFLIAHNRSALLMSAVIVAMALVLAVLLVRQGIRADRAARLARERAVLIASQSAAYGRLAVEASLFGPDGTPAPGLTETLTEATGARRCGLWRLAPGGTLRCADMYERASHGHTEGLELARGEIANFMAAVLVGDPIAAPDAAADRRIAEAHSALMREFGSRAVLAVPVRRNDRILGVVLLEDPANRDDVLHFATAVASMIAPAFAETMGAAVAATPVLESAAPAEPDTVRSRSAELTGPTPDHPPARARDFVNVTVAVLRFSDPQAGTAQNAVFADTIACALQEIADTHGIPYVKMLGEEAVTAAGFADGDADATTRIAAATLAMRDRCAAMFEDADISPVFRIGIDCGAATGSDVGREPRVFNLWGDSVRMANAMAASAPASGIQVTEAAYHRLSRHFLFRPRGSFYIPRVGAAQSFILAGHL